MTFIQPSRNSSFLNKILVILIACLFLGAIWLIILYNSMVNLSHGVSDIKAEFQTAQSQNAELKNKALSLLDMTGFSDLAGKKGLIQDKNPKYFQINPQWSFASQY